jgi:hypothetical protein
MLEEENIAQNKGPTQETLNVTTIRVGRDRLVLLGTPKDEETTPEGWHNCDYMGCGTHHVVGRAVLLRADGDPEQWNRSEAMIRILASVLGYDLVRRRPATAGSEVTP